jgi:hypothetical protein
MTATRRRRTAAIQPELPLRPPPAGRDAADDTSATVGTPGDDLAGEREWRLDEQTRQAGLRGIAFARAQLLASESTRQALLRGRGRGPSGRAA